MKYRFRIFTVLVFLGSFGCSVAAEYSESNKGKTLLAIFAHADDEIIVAPLLAKYAREGVIVKLAIVTDGRYGVPANGGTPAGEELKMVRAAEALCSTEKLGVEPPILLEYVDADVVNNLNELSVEINSLFTEIQPDIVVTSGPEGVSGNKDHRLVGAVVAGVFQAGGEGWPNAVYYPGLPDFQLENFNNVTSSSRISDDIESPLRLYVENTFSITDKKYLQYHVVVSDEDMVASREAAACHASQWDEADLAVVNALLDASEQKIYLRKSHSEGRQRSSLFAEH